MCFETFGYRFSPIYRILRRFIICWRNNFNSN
nr:MAG TPA: hypothetical protein [Caudoviricetes sp.]